MGTRIFFGYDAKGKSFVYDLDMQLEQSPNLFLWNFQKEVMVKCNRSEIIEICDDPRVTDTHIDAYKEWKARFGNDWLEKEKSFYVGRHQPKKELTLEERHKKNLEKLGKIYKGVRIGQTRYHRITRCYSCKNPLDNSVDVECVACGWILCLCGACGCGLSFHRGLNT